MQKYLFAAVLAMVATGAYSDGCPTEALKPFEKTFDGVMTTLSPKGEVTSTVRVTETHTAISCNEYTAQIVYKNPSGDTIRVLNFSGKWDEGQKLFQIVGTNIKGTFRVLKLGTYFVDFVTQFPQGAANCDELISVTGEGKNLSRTLHCVLQNEAKTPVGTRAIQSNRP